MSNIAATVPLGWTGRVPNAVATASSKDGPAYAAQHAVDQDGSSAWRAANTAMPQWLHLDLGDYYDLQKVQQTFEHDDLWGFVVEGSTNNRSWATLIEASSGRPGRTFADSATGVFRYIRLKVLSSQAGHAASSVDLSVVGTKGVRNIAAGKRVTASTNVLRHWPTNAVDGNINSYWVADGPTVPQWMVLDLGSVALVTGIEQNFKDYDHWKFAIDGSVDNRNWIRLTPLAHLREGVVGQCFRYPVEGRFRYFKLTITYSASDHWADSVDFKVFGLEDLATAATTVTSSALSAPCQSVDLGEPHVLHRVEQSFAAEQEWTFAVEGSVDTASWTSLVDSSGAVGQEFAATVAGEYRHVRLTVAGSEAEQLAASKQLAVYGLPLTSNLAPGTRVTSSTLQPGHEPFRAVDDKDTTSWTALDPGQQWLMVDLGRESLVSRVEQTFVDSAKWKFTVEGSADGHRWRTLIDHQRGRVGRVFGAEVSGSFRYVRLNVTVPADSSQRASSVELKVSGTGSPVRSRWWESQSGVARFYPVWQKLQLNAITEQLPTLKEQGHTALELTPIFEGYRETWAGLAITDLYRVSPLVGTMRDLQRLVKTAHDLDMKVIFFANPGYAHVTAPFFQKALRDFRDGVNSMERAWFDIRKEKGQYDRWVYNAEFKAWFWARWADDAPSFNFANIEWRDECRKYLRFWMDTGVDGMVLDAPNVYHYNDEERNNHAISEILLNYDDFRNGEGVRDDVAYVDQWHYNSLQDYHITQWAEPQHGPGYSAILEAIDRGNPRGLDDVLKNYRDQVLSVGGITQTPPNWGRRNYPSNKRLLEIATLITMGTLFYVHNDFYTINPTVDEFPHWPAEDLRKLWKLMRTQNSYAALAPSGLRVQLDTNDDNKYYAFLRTNRDGSVKALVVLNFQASAQQVDVQLLNAGISTDQRPIDLLADRPAPPITGPRYTVAVPAYGVSILAVD